MFCHALRWNSSFILVEDDILFLKILIQHKLLKCSVGIYTPGNFVCLFETNKQAKGSGIHFLRGNSTYEFQIHVSLFIDTSI